MLNFLQLQWQVSFLSYSSCLTPTQDIKHSLTPTDNLERRVNITDLRLWAEYPERTHTIRGRSTNSMQKDPRSGFKPRTLLLQLNSSARESGVSPEHQQTTVRHCWCFSLCFILSSSDILPFQRPKGFCFDSTFFREEF